MRLNTIWQQGQATDSNIYFDFLPLIASDHSGPWNGKVNGPFHNTAHLVLCVLMLRFLGLRKYSLNLMLGQIWPRSISLLVQFCLCLVQRSKRPPAPKRKSEVTTSVQCPWKPLVPPHSCLQLNEPLFSALLNEVAKSRPSLMVSGLDPKKMLLPMYETSPEGQKQPRPLRWGKLCTRATLWRLDLCLFPLIWFLVNINAKLEGETLRSWGRKSAQMGSLWISQDGWASPGAKNEENCSLL